MSGENLICTWKRKTLLTNPRLLLLFLLLITNSHFLEAQSRQATSAWDSRFWLAGFAGEVFATASTGSGLLYAGGSFGAVDGRLCQNLAIWNDSLWLPLAGGVNGPVYAIATSGDSVFAGGRFTLAGQTVVRNIALWDGAAWRDLGGGIGDGYESDAVWSLAFSRGVLYAGGAFGSAGGTPAPGVAMWDGSAWSGFGVGTLGRVNALAVLGDTLYAGGRFATMDTTYSPGIAAWYGGMWHPVPPLISSRIVLSLAVDDLGLIVTGGLLTSPDSLRSCVARLTGSGLSILGGSFNAKVGSLYSWEGQILAGGDFTLAGGHSANRIARWVGNQWQPFGGGFDSTVNTISVHNGGVVAAGLFSFSDSAMLPRLAHWDDKRWSRIGEISTGDGANGRIRALCRVGNDVYAGGSFTAIGNVRASRIARWDGLRWWPMGQGVNGIVQAIAQGIDGLYVGGDFTTAGGLVSPRIARWDGSQWHPLASGLDRTVYSLAVKDTEVFAGGTFSSTGATTLRRIGRWDGKQWNALGFGLGGGSIRAMAFVGDTLYVGGQFTQIDTVHTRNIARWNGTAWSQVQGGVDGSDNSIITGLATLNRDLIVAGEFSSAGGLPAASVARWDGARWTSMGSPTTGHAIALTSYAGRICLSYEDSLLSSYQNCGISRWDGTGWISIGKTDDQVLALQGIDGGIVAGGAFSSVDGLPAASIDIYHESPVVVMNGEEFQQLMFHVFPNPFNSRVNFRYAVVKRTRVELTMYDMLGRQVRRIVDETQGPGAYDASFEASSLASGIYLTRLKVDGSVQTRRIVLIR
jgi:trimeric autotransporter adhesin